MIKDSKFNPENNGDFARLKFGLINNKDYKKVFF